MWDLAAAKDSTVIISKFYEHFVPGAPERKDQYFEKAKADIKERIKKIAERTSQV